MLIKGKCRLDVFLERTGKPYPRTVRLTIAHRHSNWTNTFAQAPSTGHLRDDSSTVSYD